jgi:hypothetical protein
MKISPLHTNDNVGSWPSLYEYVSYLNYYQFEQALFEKTPAFVITPIN